MKNLYRRGIWVAVLAGATCGFLAAQAGAVRVQPVPWNPSNLSSPHTVISGQPAILAAAADLGGSQDAFTYSWRFGDGSPANEAAPVVNPYDLGVTHTYTAPAGTTYTAVITVTDTTSSTTYTGNYPVVVQANTLASRVNVAVDNGLWYLHRTMWRATTTNASEQAVPWGGWDLYVGSGPTECPTVNETAYACAYSTGSIDAMNVQAFEVSGHLETGPASDPYTDDVARGLARTLYFLVASANNANGPKTINYNPALRASRCSDGSSPNYSLTPPGCPEGSTLILYNQAANSCTNPPCTFTFDGNSNGQMLSSGNDGAPPGYETGMLLTALVATGNPNGVARMSGPGSSGGGLPGVLGQTYLNIVTDIADGINYCQYFGDSDNANGSYRGGGWYYTCSATSNLGGGNDNSIAQWNALALIAANRGFGVDIPAVVKDMNQVWLTWDQDVSPGTRGAYGYTSWDQPLWGPWATTPSGMVQLAMNGIGRTAVGVPDQRWNYSESYYRDNFCNTGSALTSPKEYTYGLFSFTKSMEQHDPLGVLKPITFLQDVPGATNPIDWYTALSPTNLGTDACDGVAQTLVGRQYADGYWTGVDYSSSQYPFETSWSVQMLQKTSFTACVSDLSGTGQAGPAVSLRWSGIGNASSYNIERSAENGGPYTTVGNTTQTAFTDNTPGLQGGTTFYYVLQPLNGDHQAICTSNQATIPVPSGGGSSGGGLTVTGGDGGVIALGGSVSVAISASGGTPPYSYASVGPLPSGISVGAGTVSGTPTLPGSYNVPVRVTDSSQPAKSASASATFSVFGFTSTALPAGITFSPYTASVTTAGGRVPYKFEFSNLPPGLSANESGTIQGTVNAPGTFNVTVKATEAGGISVSAPVTFTFAAPPTLMVPGGALRSGTVSTGYNTSLTATGGAPPLTWALTSGSLPNGLNLSSSGSLSGVPSAMGTFSFMARATDITGATAIGSFTITISPQPLTIITSTPLSTGSSGVEYAQMVSASGGTPPYTYSITSGVLPPGVTLDPNTGMIGGIPTGTGLFSFVVTATDSSGPGPAAVVRASRQYSSSVARAFAAELSQRAVTGSMTLSMNIRPAGTDLILNAGSLMFSVLTGAAAVPPAQQVSVQSTRVATPLPYSVAVNPAGTAWLSAAGGGTTPGTISVSLTNAALMLAASSTPYQADVVVTCLNPAPCSGNTQTVTVKLSVTSAPPQLSIPSDLISFTTPASNPQPSTQSLVVQNTGGGSIGIGSIGCGAAWCKISGVPGSLASGVPVTLSVTADPTGLAAGFFRTTIDLKTSAGQASVPVTLFIAAASSLTVQPSGSQFQSSAGGVPNGGDPSFLVGVSSNTPINWTASVLPGASWLSVSTPSGSAVGTQPGMVKFAIDPDIARTLAPNAYYGTIRVASTGVVNSPLDYHVVVNVGPADAIQRPAPSPQGLLFISAAGTVPPAQTVQISTNSTANISYQASASTMNGGNWLSVSPASGTATPGNPAQTQVSVTPANLNAGVYYGGITYALQGLATRTVNVTLIVPLATQAVSQDRLHLSDAEPGNCKPGALVPAQMGLVNNFSAPTAWPTPLSVRLLNDCGNTVANGQIVATFSNGDPPLVLALADPATGLYSATWTPRKSSAQVNINARASAPGFQAVTAQLVGSVTSNKAPLLAGNSTQHLYNPTPAAALAPGTLIEISGSGLAGATTTAPVGALPTVLGGTQVLIGGIPAALSSASPGVLNAQLPLELTPGMQYQVVVNANGALTTPDTVQVAATSPGVATNAAGLANAAHLDGSPVTDSSPAAPDETLVLTGAGLGQTDNPVGDGAPAPSSPLANALSPPTVTIDGTTATVTFAGLQPGTVGIYQINITVPSDAKDGNLPLVVSQDGQPGNTALLPVKKK